MKRYVLSLLLMLVSLFAFSQNDNGKVRDGYDAIRESMLEKFRASKDEMAKEYTSFRDRVMKEYVDFVRKAWDIFEGEPIPAPEEEPVPPVVMPDEDKVLPIDDTPVPINIVVEPEPEPFVPQPKPIEPIKVVPEVKDVVRFSFFGTDASVRFDVAEKVVLAGVDGNSVADALERMAAQTHENMIADCLALREKHSLSDWAYINMLLELSKEIYGDDENSAALLTAYIFMQSGYKMRLATDNAKLYMLYASKHLVYEKPCFMVGDDRYYPVGNVPPRLHICEASYVKEKPLSLIVATPQLFKYEPAETQHVASVDYPDFGFDVVVNKNLLDFYSTLPTSMIGENMYSRWAMYANTPFDRSVKERFYPQIRKKIEGMSELDAANRILNFVQTGYTYEYDDKMWGGDRVFFPDESLFYKYNDCDDRSVLFSRLVRDLLGLDAALVFVPGHVLVAVAFNDDVKGGYVTIDGRKFTLCEPTCTNGAPVGWSNVGENTELNVYLLQNQ
ncbi:MAG: transglutaminase domain-containing protein [Bacteroidaceae bacterium]|nr:transglutaminase domain-containing protein [Bacteroidaceae bacterium]